MEQSWHAWVLPRPVETLLPVQYILFTHFHPDHFHPESFALLNKDAEVVVPVSAGHYLLEKARAEGFAKTREISATHPECLGELEVHAVRIHDHWEFLDETAYLVVENGVAALFLADLWYVPPALLARLRARYPFAFASLPWGGSIENLFVLPEGYELDDLGAYYAYGTGAEVVQRRNSIMEHGEFSMIASLVNADYMIPGSFGFGWISPEEDYVKPLPVNHWLDQETFIATLPDPQVRAKLHPMYPGDTYDTLRGGTRCDGSRSPNHPVTQEMRARTRARRDGSVYLDPERVTVAGLNKVHATITRLQGASQFYRERLSELLSAENTFEIHVANEARQKFLFEQTGNRFSFRAIDRSTGLKEIVYMPPSVLRSVVEDWGPQWTEANFSSLVKVSASGWAPYRSLSVFFG